MDLPGTFRDCIVALNTDGLSVREIARRLSAVEAAPGENRKRVPPSTVATWFNGTATPRTLDDVRCLATVLQGAPEAWEAAEVVWAEERLRSEAPDAFRRFARLRRLFDPTPDEDGTSEDEARILRLRRQWDDSLEPLLCTIEGHMTDARKLFDATMATLRGAIGQAEERLDLPELGAWYGPEDEWARLHDAFLRHEPEVRRRLTRVIATMRTRADPNLVIAALEALAGGSPMEDRDAFDAFRTISYRLRGDPEALKALLVLRLAAMPKGLPRPMHWDPVVELQAKAEQDVRKLQARYERRLTSLRAQVVKLGETPCA